MKKSAAIIVNCKLDNDSLYQIVDEEFINANMKKVCEGNILEPKILIIPVSLRLDHFLRIVNLLRQSNHLLEIVVMAMKI